MSRFYFGDSDSASDDENELPYPKPLARSAFLTPEFSPTEFLSSLQNRHQTLEDLRQELRTRSQELNKELLDLVNDNYQDFLGLGGSLKGGEERVEEVRLGLLGFRREVDGLKGKVAERREEVQGLIEQRRGIVRDMRIGRGLLEVDARLEELKESLRIGAHGQGSKGAEDLGLDFSESEDESEEEDVSGNVISVSKLKMRVQQYVYVRKLAAKIGLEHPFLLKQEDRALKIRHTLLLDLGSALAQCSNSAQASLRTLKILTLYRHMGESAEAVQTIKNRG